MCPSPKHQQANDFGGEIIPSAAKDHNVVAYPFYGYWEDIGTIKSFFEENLKLCRHVRVMMRASGSEGHMVGGGRWHIRRRWHVCLQGCGAVLVSC